MNDKKKNPYATNAGGEIAALYPQKNQPKASVIRASMDLRAVGGKGKGMTNAGK